MDEMVPVYLVWIKAMMVTVIFLRKMGLISNTVVLEKVSGDTMPKP